MLGRDFYAFVAEARFEYEYVRDFNGIWKNLDSVAAISLKSWAFYSEMFANLPFM